MALTPSVGHLILLQLDFFNYRPLTEYILLVHILLHFFFQTMLSQDEMLNDSRFLTPTFEDWRWCFSVTKNTNTSYLSRGVARRHLMLWYCRVLPLSHQWDSPHSIFFFFANIATLHRLLPSALFLYYVMSNRYWEKLYRTVYFLESGKTVCFTLVFCHLFTCVFLYCSRKELLYFFIFIINL